MIIKNRDRLLANRDGTVRRDLLQIIEYTLDAIDPETLISQHMHIQEGMLTVDHLTFDLHKLRHIIVIGAGKATYKMARGIEKILKSHIYAGTINVPYGEYQNLSKIKIHQANHPIADENSIKGTEEMFALLQNLTLSDLVICLISGGASALLTLLPPGITLEDRKKLDALLIDSGATIQEINTVRKHVSLVKGGKLAAQIYPATCLSLIISDIPGNDIEMVGSGPTIMDNTSYKDSLKILKDYKLESRVPRAIINYLKQHLSDTDQYKKPNLSTFNILIGSNGVACNAAQFKAKALGYKTLLLTTQLEGESKVIGTLFGNIARDCKINHIPGRPPYAIIAGGETTVTIRTAKGIGGRNQELALAAALKLHTVSNVAIAAVGTDGIDGSSKYAGAMVDNSTYEKILQLQCDPYKTLESHDSTTLLEKTEDVIYTGPTYTNVSDIIIVLIR